MWCGWEQSDNGAPPKGYYKRVLLVPNGRVPFSLTIYALFIDAAVLRGV